jgi:hypothetical protein
MMGFDRFYGFMGGDCNQWYPSLFWDHHPVAEAVMEEVVKASAEEISPLVKPVGAVAVACTAAVSKS